MGLFYAIIFGILGIIVVSKIASKAIPREEKPSEIPPTPALKEKDEVSHLESLVALLIKKDIITEDELMEEISKATEHNEID